VPAIVDATGEYCCPRCGALPRGQQTAAHTVGVAQSAAHGLDLAASAKSQSSTPPVDLDEWDLDQDLRHMQGLVGGRTFTRPPQPLLPSGGNLPLPSYASLSVPAVAPIPSRQKPAARNKPPGSSLLAWASLSLGLMAFVCGAVLLVWSFADGRSSLWNLGMPITVAGQAGLLIGLVLQLERIWQGSRYTSVQLDHVDEQLHDLKQSASLLGVTHGSASQAFYAHLSEGASPNLLLADLKGQLDLLAVKMSERR
jgi:hypothetical protein